jgi:DNA invertase Pin-like site-specific DNA recombinase
MHPSPPVVDGYVASTAGSRPQDSVEQQRAQLRRATAIRGWELRRIFTAPGLEAVVTRVESHESDGLVIARMVCLGSSLVEVLTVLERVQAAGGCFLSVSDGIDLDAETGRLALRVLVALTCDIAPRCSRPPKDR